VLGATEEISIVAERGNPISQLHTAVSLLDLLPSSFKILKLKDKNGAEYSLERFIADFGITVQSGLLGAAATDDWGIFVFGQTERFDDKGLRMSTASVAPRLGIALRLKNTDTARSSLNLWERTMLFDLKELFNHDPEKSSIKDFSDNIYGENSIRYLNFPYSDQSIDYVILEPFYIPADRNIDYLIITSSKESIYRAIDTLGNIGK
jgi:hypothetical protein